MGFIGSASDNAFSTEPEVQDNSYVFGYLLKIFVVVKGSGNEFDVNGVDETVDSQVVG